MRKLGSVQTFVLGSLVKQGEWSKQRCGWMWDTPSGTERIMKSLVAKGLVKVKVPKGAMPRYTPTAAGKKAVVSV